MKYCFIFIALSFALRLSAQTTDSCSCVIPSKKYCTGDTSNTSIPQIIFDYATKQVLGLDRIKNLKRPDPFFVRVINYNPFLYNVIVNDSDTHSYPMIDANNVLSYVLNPSNLAAIATNLLQTPAAAPPKIHNANQVLWAYDSVVKKTLIDIFIDDEKDTATKYTKQINELTDNINTSLFTWAKMLEIKSKISVTCSDFVISKDTVNAIEQTWIKYVNEIHKLKQNLLNHQEYYLEKSSDSPYNKILTTTADSVIHKYILKFYSQALTTVQSMDSALNLKNLETVRMQLLPLADIKPNFLSGELFKKDDIKTVNIMLKPWKDTAGIETYSTSFQIPWFIKSVYGITAGFYGGGLYNIPYTDQAIDATHYQLTKDKSSKFELGIDALAYAAWNQNANSDNAAYLGITFGAGLSINQKPKPRVLIGPILIIGTKNRFSISSGLIGGPVERLSSAYNTTDSYLSATSNYMIDVFKLSGFVSINFSFLSK